jgi:hypothetical protein
MIILPTLRRPHLLQKFIHAYKQTQAILPVHVILDASDAAGYDAVKLPSHWQRVTVPPGKRLGGIYKLVYETFPMEPFYAMIGDDVLPETMHWDVALQENCLPDKIAWGWDGIQNEKLPTHPFIGGDLVRRLGWFAAPGMQQYFVDNVWKHLADALNCGAYLPQVRMRHCHHLSGDRPIDRTDEEAPSMGNDQNAYTKFMHNDFPALIERVRVKSA